MKALAKAVSRRGVLRGFGGGAALATTKAMGAAELSGVSPAGAIGLVNDVDAPIAHGEPHSKLRAILKTLTQLPEWKLKELREQSKRVSQFDLDLAACRSMSNSARFTIQRQRQFEKAKTRAWKVGDDGGREKWLAGFGLDRWSW